MSTTIHPTPSERTLSARLPRVVQLLVALTIGGAAAVLTPLRAQSGPDPDAEEAYAHETAPRTYAVRTDAPISVDGRLDEDVWMSAPAITEFLQTVPDEGRPVTERTEVRFLYDDDDIYLGAWLWDEGEVLTRLARRDAGVPDADFFVVLFDSYHDHSTAYRFATSPSAMKRDEIVTGGYGRGGGGFGDTSWDPVWDVATTITDEGWFVEIRVPLSQLRYRADEVQSWGLQVERKIRRKGEDTVWAFTPRNQPGGVNRYGHLDGIRGIPQGKRLELLPFVTGRMEDRQIPVSENAGFPNPYRSGSDFFVNAGVDLKYRLGSNLTLDGTVNPDFGQVELDPAVINLSAFETRYDERRPFFVEGAEIFRFGGGGRSDAQLLYSRRIGRPPQGSVPSEAEYADVPTSTTILGALKLTGKTSDGWSVGVLDAVGERVQAPWVGVGGTGSKAEVEPLTNYFAGSVRRDLDEGTRSFGAMGTAVHRSFADAASAANPLDAVLHGSAYTLGVDGRVESRDQRWALAAKVAGSRVDGSAEAIARTQRSSARYFQRPDADHLTYDPNASDMNGFFGRIDAAKQSGTWQGSLGLAATSPGFEVNDLGFQSTADRVDLSWDFGYRKPQAGEVFRNFNVGASGGTELNFAGEAVASDIGLSVNATHVSFNGFNVRASRQFETWNDRLTRGGPLTREPAGYSGSIGFNTDSRNLVQLRSSFQLAKDDGGGWRRGGNIGLTFRFQEIYEIQLGGSVNRSRNPAQYVTRVSDPSASETFGARYVFAAIDQTTYDLDTRVNITFTPNLTFELYAQPFISSGDYLDLKELAAPGTFDFSVYGQDTGTVTREDDGSYTVDPDGTGTRDFDVGDRDFNVRSLLGNAVLRWEWRPGSTLFLVWQQTRSERLAASALGGAEGTYGSTDFDQDARALLNVRPENTFMIKMTYWLNP